MQVIKVRRPCLYCKVFKVRKKGFYFVKSKPHWRRRYDCGNCGKSFNSYKLQKLKSSRLGSQIFREIKKLINIKTYPSKYDNRENKYYPSSRMIVKIIRKRFKRDIGKSTTHKLIQTYRVQTPGK